MTLEELENCGGNPKKKKECCLPSYTPPAYTPPAYTPQGLTGTGALVPTNRLNYREEADPRKHPGGSLYNYQDVDD